MFKMNTLLKLFIKEEEKRKKCKQTFVTRETQGNLLVAA